MKFRPLHDRIIVKRIERQDGSRGGVVIPDTAKETPQEGEVVAVGPGARGEQGTPVPLDVKAGDRVLFGKGVGAEVKLDGVDLVIMKESEVLSALSGPGPETGTRASPPARLRDDPGAYTPGPRARALLRGREIAEDDLAKSGGSYSLEDVRRLSGEVSRQSIEKRVREGRLLAVSGPNGKRYYPVAQFRDDGSVVDGLRAVREAMATQDGFALLNFLVNPAPQLDARKPIDLLKQGQVDRVVEAAARIGEQGG